MIKVKREAICLRQIKIYSLANPQERKLDTSPIKTNTWQNNCKAQQTLKFRHKTSKPET